MPHSLPCVLQTTSTEGMAGPDIAEQVDEMICVMDKVVGSQMDTIIILLVGWLLFGAVIFLVSHLVYSTINTEPASGSLTAPGENISINKNISLVKIFQARPSSLSPRPQTCRR